MKNEDRQVVKEEFLKDFDMMDDVIIIGKAKDGIYIADTFKPESRLKVLGKYIREVCHWNLKDMATFLIAITLEAHAGIDDEKDGGNNG